MESVKRYFWVSDGMAEGGKARDSYVSGADFDRVSAENLALQERLTVQDQRVDELTELLKEAQKAMPWISNSELWERIYAALKPTAEAVSGLTCNQIREESGLPINNPLHRLQQRRVHRSVITMTNKTITLSRELVERIANPKDCDDGYFQDIEKLRAALKPTESGASE